ncbi:MAG: flagellar basal body P-ring formation chaperone FlgA [Mariniblastus sp.]
MRNLFSIRESFAGFMVVFLLCVFGNQICLGQAGIQLATQEVRCHEDTVKLKHIANVLASDVQIANKIKNLDIDQFGVEKKRISISKEQVRIRLMLAGLAESQFQLTGPKDVTLVRVGATSGSQLKSKHELVRQLITRTLKERFSGHYGIPIEDLKIDIDSNFIIGDSLGPHVVNLTFLRAFDNEIPLGRRVIDVSLGDTKGRSKRVRLTVSIAVIRNLVVANKNISKGQMLSPGDVAAVRRPVFQRNVRYASFEQVVGTQAQSDIQQYDVIKSNSLRKTRSGPAIVIERNSYVNIVARRGSLSVTLKDAKALENGELGGKIAVINPSTNERIVAKVINASTVEIRF